MSMFHTHDKHTIDSKLHRIEPYKDSKFQVDDLYEFLETRTRNVKPIRYSQIDCDIKKGPGYHKFWTLIKKIDISIEKKCDVAYVSSKLTDEQKKYVKCTMIHFIGILNKSLDKLKCVKDKSNEYKANLYSYIIGRGVQYYMLVLTTPSIADTIEDEYVPLWSYL